MMVHTLFVLLLFVVLLVSPCLVAGSVDMDEEENRISDESWCVACEEQRSTARRRMERLEGVRRANGAHGVLHEVQSRDGGSR